jgi:hypothetical protein
MAVVDLIDKFGQRVDQSHTDRAFSTTIDQCCNPAVCARIHSQLNATFLFSGNVSRSFENLLCARETSPHQSHQKRPNQSATNAIEFKRKTAKSTNLIDTLPLIMVWLQVRVTGCTTEPVADKWSFRSSHKKRLRRLPPHAARPSFYTLGKPNTAPYGKHLSTRRVF